MKISQNPLYTLLRYARVPRGKIILATLCSIANKLCDIVPEILIGLSIDIIVNQQHSMVAQLSGISDPLNQLYVVGTLTAVLWILESAFEYLYAILWRSCAQEVQHNLRIKAYSHLQNLESAYFENKTTGGLLAVLHDDIQQLEQFLSEGPNEVIQLVVNIVVMGAIFFYLSPMLALTAVIPIPFVVGIAYYFQNRLAVLYGQVRECSAQVASHIAHRLQGITTIKSSVTQSYEVELLTRESECYQEAKYNSGRENAAYVPTVRMGIMVGFISSLIVGGRYALMGYLPINWYASLVFLTQRFLWPFTQVTTITDMYERSMASARRICAMLDQKIEMKEGSAKLDLKTVQGMIHFQNVSFSYPNGKKIFNNLSLEIPAGKTIAFVGTTGSGKSTITKLLLRFYEATGGSVMIDGIDIKSLSLDDLRHAIALVSQETYLVDGTIAENIAYGTFGATHEEIVNAAKMADADSFIMALPNGYDTRLSENGKNLSGGQRQRIAIARAIVKKAPILIFDEATSAVDNETEAAIQKSFIHLAHNHTIILIAHRLSTVRHADTIFVMEDGKIKESGSHQQLTQRAGIYAKLWNLQAGHVTQIAG